MELSEPVNDDLYAEHNAEQKQVWDAFRGGRPLRVPVLISSNPRMILLDPPLNRRDRTFEQYMTEPEIMLEVMIDFLYWVRHSLWFDQEMGLPDDGWRVWVDFQNVHEAAWLGAPVHFAANNCPYAAPLLDEDRKNLLFDRGIPDPFNDGGWMQRNWEFYDHFCRVRDAGTEFHGRPIVDAQPASMITDGLFTIAMELRGEDACLDMLVDADYFHRLMNYLTEATITRMRAYRRRLGLPDRSDDFIYADDSIALISAEQFREHVLPYHRRLVEAFWTGKGQLMIHLCGDASRHFPILKDELRVLAFDTGFPIDLHKMRRQLGPEVLLQGGPTVGLLHDGPIERIEAETRALLAGPVAQGRFVLHEANNLAPGTPPEHVKVMYEAARRFGRY